MNLERELSKTLAVFNKTKKKLTHLIDLCIENEEGAKRKREFAREEYVLKKADAAKQEREALAVKLKANKSLEAINNIIGE
jgi:hypothetical protein